MGWNSEVVPFDASKGFDSEKSKEAAVDQSLPKFTYSGQGAFRPDAWGKGTAIGIALISPALAIGLSMKLRPIDVRDMPFDWNDEEVLFQVFLPILLWYIFTTWLTGEIAYRFGRDMLEESNSGMKDAARSNITNSGVVLALILSIAMVFLQAECPFEEDLKRLTMWYRALLVLATEVCFKGVMISAFVLVYLEPLSDKAAMVFILDNTNYIGEPAAGLVLGLLYFAGAIILYFFGMDGAFTGLLASLVLGFLVIRTIVILIYMKAWKNPAVDAAMRAKRNNVMKDAAAGRPSPQPAETE